MANASTLRGAFTALITPFRDGAVDLDALRELVDRQIDGGIDGLVPCGTTGEAATLSYDEQLDVIRVVVDQAKGRVPVIAGTGTNNTRNTLAFTKRVAELSGVDAALVVVPYYNKPNQPGIIHHYTQIAEQGGLPVVLYNVPGRTVVSMTPATIATLAAHPNIIAVKEASGSMRFAAEVFAALGARDDFALLSGDDFTTMPFIAMGGHGCVSVLSNLDPGGLSTLVSDAAGANLAAARAKNLALQALASALFERPNPVPTKAVAAHLGWCTDEVRSPLVPADEAFVDRVVSLAAAYGLTRDA
ncbi:MAG: 4-hydroxy-tetrahydrodipicolinate synthase [Myxococcota bacterium]